MLKILRKKGLAKKILWAVAIMIIVSFVFWGTGNIANSPKGKYNYAGKIHGKKISFEEFEYSYRATVLQAMLRYGDQFKEVRDYLNLESEAWDRLLLLRAAKKEKIQVTDPEVVKYIASIPYFQKDGAFESQMYELILQRAFHISGRAFEEYMRENRKILKLYEKITSPFTVSEKEILQAYKEANEKVQVTYVFLPYEKFKTRTNIDAAKAEAFYESNKAEFTRPASVDLEYVKFDKPESDVKISKEEKQNSEAPEKEDEKNGPSAEENAANQKAKESAEQFYKQVELTGEFEKAASENKTAVQTTGIFSMDKPNLSLGWPYEVLYMVFQLKPGNLMPAFETTDGYVVARLKERREPAVPEFDEVKGEVEDKIRMIEAKELTKAKADELAAAIKTESTENKKFSAIAKELNLDLSQTPLFVRGEYLPQIGIAADFQETAFALTEESPISGPVQTQKGFAIMHRDHYEGVDEKAFAEAKNDLQAQLLARKQTAMFSDYLAKLRLEANLEDNVSKMKEEKK